MTSIYLSLSASTSMTMSALSFTGLNEPSTTTVWPE
jgi:hypothetical protein